MAGTASPGLRTVVIAQRKRRRANAVGAGVVALLVAWCLHSVVADTEWTRIGGSLGFIAALQRFLALNINLAPQLVTPAIETFMMATLGTLLGCLFSLPVAWLRGVDVAPGGHLAYSGARL